ncbi:MAG: hypothetical protein ACT4QG_01870 [Sporichthyaceae bacterium]
MIARLTRRWVVPSAAEVGAALPGDEIVAAPDAVMDRGFTVPGTPAQVWPWIVQLGKGRAGWYLPRGVERFLPPRNRAIREIDGRWQVLVPGTVVPDYGRNETLEVVSIDAPRSLVFQSRRKHLLLTWTIVLTPVPEGTRVHLRLRMGPIKRQWLVNSVGEVFDWLTIAGMAAGLRERVVGSAAGNQPA